MSQLAVPSRPRSVRLRTAVLGGATAVALIVAPAVGPARAAAITTSLGSVATASPSSSGSSSSATTWTGSSRT